ncbi:MAG: hypothetical protein EBQ49_07950 [Verrucomicrobia bacterium]|nr:hypothetical protein [Verrucomicrobiota bacterium]
MSLETPPPPPPPPPSSDGDANSAPKLKLNKPAGAFVPPPPPSAGSIPPPPPAAAIPRPPVVGAGPASAPRIAPTFSSEPNSSVSTLEASFDVLGMVASIAAFAFLLLELFVKTKG